MTNTNSEQCEKGPVLRNKSKALFVYTIVFSLLFSQFAVATGSIFKPVPKLKLIKSSVYRPNDGYIVKLKKSVSLKNFSSKDLNKENLTLKVSKEEADKLKKEGKVVYEEPNYVRKILLTPNDQYFSYQYSLKKMSVPSGWDIENGSSNGVTVAVIDTGVDLKHPDLSAKVVQGYDFVNNDSNPQDDQGHGTHVAGIIAAGTNNKIGVSGISWGAKIMPVKVLDYNGSGSDFDVANGIRYAVDHGAKIINLSLGGTWYSETLDSATTYAYNKGVTVFAAAGNDGDTSLNYPAADSHVVGVGATDANDKRAWFSNHNPSVDISAPGVDVLSTYYDGSHDYAYMSGTSMASPQAAGLAAVLLSKNPTLNVDGLARVVEASASDLGSVGRDDYYGYGRINLYNALKDNVSSIYINAPSSIRYGQKIVFNGSLKPQVSAQPIMVKKKGLKSLSWGPPVQVVTDVNGLFSFTDKPLSSTQYMFSLPGTADLMGAATIFQVLVKPKISLNSNRKIFNEGRSVVVSGYVYPNRRGRLVKVYIYKSGKRYLKTAKLYGSWKDRSKFALKFKPDKKGTYRIRARFQDGSHNATNSHLIKLNVK